MRFFKCVFLSKGDVMWFLSTRTHNYSLNWWANTGKKYRPSPQTLLSSTHLQPKQLHESSLSACMNVLNLIFTQIHQCYQCSNSSESSTEHNGNVPLYRQLLIKHRHKQCFASSFAWLKMRNLSFPFSNTTTSYS